MLQHRQISLLTKRIHIVGVSPRTGTTLMAEAMKTCFSIDYCTKHEDRLFTRAPCGNEIFLSKAPKDIMIVGPSLKADPDLYVICMIRDPRDIISSKHKKDPDRYWAGLKFWKLYIREVEKLKGHPRFIPVVYEELVTDPDHIQSEIEEKIPFLKKTRLFSEFHRSAEVSEASLEALRSVRPIKPESIGRWREHKARVAGQIQLHGDFSDDLIRYGYEKDSIWLQELEGVEPDTSTSHFSEYWIPKSRFFLKFGKYAEAVRRTLEHEIGCRIRITHPKKWFR